MRHSKMIGYVLGCVAVLTVGAVLAKGPEQTAARGVSTPPGCMDSLRGRTHILRFCGDEHYWIKRPIGPSRWGLSELRGLDFGTGQTVSSGSDTVSSAGLNGAGR